MMTGASRAFGWLAYVGLMVGCVGSAAAQPAASAWPLFHGNAQRTGRTAVVGPASPTNVRVAFESFGAIRSTPVIGPDGRVYLGTARKLCAIDPSNNDNVDWCNDINATVIFASPALGVDPMNAARVLVYVGGRDNKMHAIDQDGLTRWLYAVGIDGDVATSAVISASGSVFFGGSSRMHSMTPNGALNWVQGLDGVVFVANPALSPSGNTVYVGTISGSLYAFDPATGAERWRITVGRNIRFSAPAVAADGTIYVGTRDGLVSVTDNGNSATINWTFPMSGRGVVSTPAIGADGTVYVGGQGVLGGGGAAFYAIDPDGNEVWSYPTPKFFRGSPVIDGAGRIYTTSGKTVMAFNSANGSLAWSYATKRNIYASPVLDGAGTLWIGGSDRNLYAISD